MEGHLEPLKSLEAGVTQSDFGRPPRLGRDQTQVWPPSARRATLAPSLPRLSRSSASSSPAKPQMPVSVPENFPRRLSLSMLGGGAGLGSGSCSNSAFPRRVWGLASLAGDGLGGRPGARQVGAGRGPPGCRPGAARGARGPSPAPRGPGSPLAPPRRPAFPGSPLGSRGGARADRGGKEGPPPVSGLSWEVWLHLIPAAGRPLRVREITLKGGRDLSRMQRVLLSACGQKTP